MKKVFKKDKISEIAKELIKQACDIQLDSATIIALSGDLGAGKTTIAQEVARILGIKENVISPTFVIMKNYACPTGNFKKLIHIDAYRLSKSQELLNLGWAELVADKDNLILIEWPELVPECIPENGVCRVNLSHIDEQTRGIEIML